MASIQHHLLKFTLTNMNNTWRQKHQSIRALRRTLETSSLMLYLPPGVDAQPFKVRHMPAEWLTSRGQTHDKVMLYLHGGGYAVGSIQTHRALAARLAEQAGCRCLIIDYRLAPEHPFPAALEDAVEAYVWLLEQGMDARNIIMAGDSAGGGLCLASQLLLRQMHMPLPAATVCFSPWVDLTRISESAQKEAMNDPIVPLEELMDWVDMYANGTSFAYPMISPLFADMQGFPPVFIQASTTEVFTDQAVRLAKHLKECSVPHELHLWPDMLHVWQVMWQFIPEGDAAIDQAAAFMKKQWAHRRQQADDASEEIAA